MLRPQSNDVKWKKWWLFSCRSQWCFHSSRLSHEWFSQPTYNDIFIFRIHRGLGDDFQSRIAIENTVRRQTTFELVKIFMSILSEIFQYVLKYHEVLFSKHTDEYLGHLHDFILLCLICQKGVRDKMCLHPPSPTPVIPCSVTWVPLVFSALSIFNKISFCTNTVVASQPCDQDERIWKGNPFSTFCCFWEFRSHPLLPRQGLWWWGPGLMEVRYKQENDVNIIVWEATRWGSSVNWKPAQR